MHITGDRFELRNAGKKRCPRGSGIFDKEVCIEACKELDIPLSGKRFKNGKPCYKGGKRRVCNQNGAFSRRSSLICCKEERKMMQQSWYFAELDKQRK